MRVLNGRGTRMQAVLAMTALTLSACGGATEEETPQAPSVVRALRLCLEPSANQQLNDALRAAFIRAGYTIFIGADSPCDSSVHASVNTSAVQGQSFLQVGVPQAKYKTTVGLTVLLPDGRVIDQVSTEYVAAMGDGPSTDKLRELVQSLRDSGRLEGAARQRRQSQVDEVNAEGHTRLRYAGASGEAAGADTSAAWAQIKGDCGEAPSTSESCDRLRSWLSQERGRYNSINGRQSPHQAQIADAEATLRKAQPVLERLQWALIRGNCGPAPPSIDACDGLRAWLARATNPNTRYTVAWDGLVTTPSPERVVQAQSTLAQAEPALAKLREDRDWSLLNLTPCSQARGPTADDIRKACALMRTFLAAYPNTTHGDEIHAVLDPADQRAATLDAMEQAAAKRRADEEARQKKADEKAASEKRRVQCMSVCRMRCANSLRFDECFAGCPGLCQ